MTSLKILIHDGPGGGEWRQADLFSGLAVTHLSLRAGPLESGIAFAKATKGGKLVQGSPEVEISDCGGGLALFGTSRAWSGWKHFKYMGLPRDYATKLCHKFWHKGDCLLIVAKYLAEAPAAAEEEGG